MVFSPKYGNFIGLDPSPYNGTHQLAYHHDNILPKSGFSKSSSTSPPEHFSCHVLRSKNGTKWGLSETSWDKMGQVINQMIFKGNMTCSVDINRSLALTVTTWFVFSQGLETHHGNMYLMYLWTRVICKSTFDHCKPRAAQNQKCIINTYNMYIYI